MHRTVSYPLIVRGRCFRGLAPSSPPLYCTVGAILDSGRQGGGGGGRGDWSIPYPTNFGRLDVGSAGNFGITLMCYKRKSWRRVRDFIHFCASFL